MLIFKKEKRVVQLILQHIEKTENSVQETTIALKEYVSDGRSEALVSNSHVYSLESEADTLLRKIRELLYSGAYLPSIRGDIYRLMSTVDSVSNKAESCFDFFRNQKPDIPEEYRSKYIDALDLTSECLVEFRSALEAFFGPKNKLDSVKTHSRMVGELESKIDQIERELTAMIFSSSMDKGDKIHLRQALDRVAAISDTTENAADELELISLKSIV
jgi:predicted phosphate transport protein (TIGR00153 family)